MITSRINSLDLLRVIAIFCVMLIHSHLSGDVKDLSPVLVLTQFLEMGAVPVFFVLSGYLGARKINLKDIDLYSYARDKFRTLVVPFLFWNVLVLSLVFIAKYVGMSALTRGNGAYFDVEPTFTSIAAALLGIGRLPIVYQFWFLRDLIVVSMVSFVICRCTPRSLLLLLLLLLAPFRMAGSLFFYLLGYHLKNYFPDFEFSQPRMAGACCVAALVLGWGAGSMQAYIPSLVLGIGSAALLFYLASMLYRFPIGKRLAALGASTFVAYAIHEPMQTIIFRIWQAKAWPGFGSAFCFYLVPLLVFGLAVCIYSMVRNYFPRLLPLMTGGR